MARQEVPAPQKAIPFRTMPKENGPRDPEPLSSDPFSRLAGSGEPIQFRSKEKLQGGSCINAPLPGIFPRFAVSRERDLFTDALTQGEVSIQFDLRAITRQLEGVSRFA